MGIKSTLKKVSNTLILLSLSVASGALAGATISFLFMNSESLIMMYGSILYFIFLHAMGGVIGGVIGLTLVKSLKTRGIVSIQTLG